VAGRGCKPRSSGVAAGDPSHARPWRSSGLLRWWRSVSSRSSSSGRWPSSSWRSRHTDSSFSTILWLFASRIATARQCGCRTSGSFPSRRLTCPPAMTSSSRADGSREPRTPREKRAADGAEAGTTASAHRPGGGARRCRGDPARHRPGSGCSASRPRSTPRRCPHHGPRRAARRRPPRLRGHVLNRCPVPSSPSAPRTPK
jgi:hypothetical protein